VRPNHIWRPLVEKAGYTMETFRILGMHSSISSRTCRRNCAPRGERKVYGIGFQMNTTGNDSNALFDYFLAAYGARNLVTPDGKLHLDDPQVKEGVIKSLIYPTTAYKEGFVPPGAINWNDADDNNAFHAETDRDGSRRHDLDRSPPS